jgi:uncharacterized damage-inducible protein DinB
MSNELERYLAIWESEAAKTVKLLESLPRDRYDFRPDPEGRSLGEMAWHLAEAEAYGTLMIERGGFSRDMRPEGMERPRKIEELGPAFERVHRAAVSRVRALAERDLEKSIDFNGHPASVRDLLWGFVLLHGIHHRGQLALLCRQAGGKPISLFGPTR